MAEHDSIPIEQHQRIALGMAPPDDDLSAEILSRLVGKDFPVYVVDGLVLYLSAGIPPGSFLRALLENDLLEAVKRADEPSERCAFAIVRWLYQWAPADAWGNRSNVADWLTERRAERERKAS